VSKSEVVAKYIPFLRRYARALTGAQSAGDAYVAAALAALVEDPSVLDNGRDPRVVLFQLFTKIWSSVVQNETAEAVDDARLPEQKLAKLRPLPRQAFLLMALQGFCEADAAKILECDITTLRRLVNETGRVLASEIATDVLIIEDDILIALDLTELVENLGHRVVGVARTHAEAVKLAQAKQPGLILTDVQLADGSSGLDAARELLRSFEVPVIFITAYPERFLTEERPEPAFLISKPFQPAMVSAIASQALFVARTAKRARRISA
jgi:CheY-like chemotaxis protein/DNA-directed RNA polymerase specialized sigma24 family protein